MKKGPFILAVALILVAIGLLIRSVIQSPGPGNPGNTVVFATIPPSGSTNVSTATVLPDARPIRWGKPTNLSPDSKFVVHGLKADDLTIVGTNPPPASTNLVVPSK